MPHTVVRTSPTQPLLQDLSQGPLVGSRTQLHRTLRRRRVLLAGLLVSVLVSLALALVTGQGPGWGVHAAADLLLLTYLAVLIHSRNAAAEQEMTRRQLGGSA